MRRTHHDRDRLPGRRRPQESRESSGKARRANVQSTGAVKGLRAQQGRTRAEDRGAQPGERIWRPEVVGTSTSAPVGTADGTASPACAAGPRACRAPEGWWKAARQPLPPVTAHTSSLTGSNATVTTGSGGLSPACARTTHSACPPHPAIACATSPRGADAPGASALPRPRL